MNCSELISSHLSHIEDGFFCEARPDGSAIVVTPYRLPDGDLVELVVEAESSGDVVVRDLGETIAMLAVQGFDPHASEKRKWLLERAVRLTDVSVDQGELRKQGPADQAGALLLDVAAAARGVADLIYLHRSQEPRNFDSRVVEFMADHASEVQPRAAVKGLSGHTYRVTAKVLRTDKTPLLISALSPRRPGIKASVDRTIRQWVDVDGALDRTQKVSFLNDLSVEWKPSDLALLDRFSLVSTWRTRHALEPVLAGTRDEPERVEAQPPIDEIG
jgi:hypothetical protein